MWRARAGYATTAERCDVDVDGEGRPSMREGPAAEITTREPREPTTLVGSGAAGRNAHRNLRIAGKTLAPRGSPDPERRYTGADDWNVGTTLRPPLVPKNPAAPTMDGWGGGRGRKGGKRVDGRGMDRIPATSREGRRKPGKVTANYHPSEGVQSSRIECNRPNSIGGEYGICSGARTARAGASSPARCVVLSAGIGIGIGIGLGIGIGSPSSPSGAHGRDWPPPSNSECGRGWGIGQARLEDEAGDIGDTCCGYGNETPALLGRAKLAGTGASWPDACAAEEGPRTAVVLRAAAERQRQLVWRLRRRLATRRTGARHSALHSTLSQRQNETKLGRSFTGTPLANLRLPERRYG
ncbi:hypothetical protein K438DRAFT_1774565 [Mycena galopus ATCC 62051]|nr:hypothetical protein K438DRAFT_1774565 [Mycena galopus ATCC 62051]